MPRKTPPRKQPEVKTGRRRFDGELLDIPGGAALIGDTEKGTRSKVARGLLPYRRLGGRAKKLIRQLRALVAQLEQRNATLERRIAELEAGALRPRHAAGGNKARERRRRGTDRRTATVAGGAEAGEESLVSGCRTTPIDSRM